MIYPSPNHLPQVDRPKKEGLLRSDVTESICPNLIKVEDYSIVLMPPPAPLAKAPGTARGSRTGETWSYIDGA